MFRSNQTNRLQNRNKSAKGIIISMAATIAILAAGTFAVSAQTPAKQQDRAIEQSANQPAATELRGTTAEQPATTRRQVRVIPLFNTPSNPTGFEGK